MNFLGFSPTNSCLGLLILLRFSAIYSFQCVIHPMLRASANPLSTSTQEKSFLNSLKLDNKDNSNNNTGSNNNTSSLNTGNSKLDILSKIKSLSKKIEKPVEEIQRKNSDEEISLGELMAMKKKRE